MILSAAILKHVKPSSLLLLVVATAVPSCLVYDKALLDEAVGGEGGNVGVGGTGALTGGAGGVGETGGAGSVTGGTDGGGGGTAAGGTDPGTGGEANCDDPPGDFTGVHETKLIDDFNIDWPRLTNSDFSWDGGWTSSGDDQIDNNYTPRTNPANGDAWMAVPGYQSHSCDQNDLALHFEATGSVGAPGVAWGVTFDARLLLDPANVDLTEFAGVVFWARSSNSSKIDLVIASAEDPDNGARTPLGPTPGGWKQFQIPFHADVVKDEVAIVKLNFKSPSDDEGVIDVWIENISFYKDAPPAEAL